MALEYRLTLAGDTSPAEVATRAFPDGTERPTPYENLLVANHYGLFGYDFTIRSGQNDRDENDHDLDPPSVENWDWEPQTYVRVSFRLTKNPERQDEAIENMLRTVARILDSGPEDAAFLFNTDLLLLTRFGGTLRKHHRSLWWDQYQSSQTILPG